MDRWSANHNLPFFVFPSVPYPIHGFLGIICGLLTAWAIRKRRQKRVEDALTKHEGMHTVGPLIEALDFYWDKNAQEVAAASLLRLLPCMQYSDANSLNASQRNSLRQALMDSENINLIVAILEAFQRWGDSQDLAYVEQLADGQGRPATDKRVQVAAQAILPSLRERTERERQAQLLLRPSRSGEPADTLVRPADSVSEASPHTLLRPSAPGEEE